MTNSETHGFCKRYSRKQVIASSAQAARHPSAAEPRHSAAPRRPGTPATTRVDHPTRLAGGWSAHCQVIDFGTDALRARF